MENIDGEQNETSIMTDNNDIKQEHEWSDEQLLKYLQDGLSADEQHAIESKMADSPFMNDAVEGLQQMKDKRDIKDYVQQLNDQLHKQTAAKQKRKNKRKFKQQDWIMMAVIILLLLCMLGFW